MCYVSITQRPDRVHDLQEGWGHGLQFHHPLQAPPHRGGGIRPQIRRQAPPLLQLRGGPCYTNVTLTGRRRAAVLHIGHTNWP
eukprot:7036279-Pyramimonas_sp.AAC.1